MKTKQKLLFLLPLLFLFAPLFSSAQFITTNAPCEPEIIPPLGQVEGVYCPYCSNKGEYLHLKWDLKTNFQDPVCGIECWGPSGDQCSDSWYSGEKFFDQNGNRKTKLKPKDDVFVKKPPTSTRSAVPGTNLQVSCREKNNPKITQLSAGIRVYSDNACGEPVTGEPCEVPFGEIINKLDTFQKTPITEMYFSDWGQYGESDSLTKGGSGEGADLDNAINEEQCHFRSHIYEELYECREDCGTPADSGPEALLNYFSNISMTEDALDFGINIFRRTTNEEEYEFIYGHSIILLSVNTSDNRTFNIKYLDPNGPNISTMPCFTRPSRITGKNILRCDYSSNILSGELVAVPYFTRSDYLLYLNLKSSLPVRRKTARWLEDPKNFPDLENFSSIDNPVGVCSGWTRFVLKVAYLGDFVGYDYHPNDGKIVGRDCDENHYPINKSLKETKTLKSSQLGSLNWLANAWMAWGNLIKF